MVVPKSLVSTRYIVKSYDTGCFSPAWDVTPKYHSPPAPKFDNTMKLLVLTMSTGGDVVSAKMSRFGNGAGELALGVMTMANSSVSAGMPSE